MNSSAAIVAKVVRSKLFVWAVIVLFVLRPVGPLFLSSSRGQIADPLKMILHHLGFVAAVLLVTVLTFTPLRVLFPQSAVVQALNRHRRLVGVAAALVALLHFGVHLIYEGGTDVASLPSILQTAVKKRFQLTGLVALTILLLLAVTSLHSIVRWMGAKRWKRLHRLAYVAAALVAYHEISARKVFPREVLWLFVPLVALELLRLARQHLASRHAGAV